MSHKRPTQPRNERRQSSGYKPRSVSGRSANQKRYIQAIQAADITLSHGPAGSGKTHIAVGVAVEMMKNNAIERIAITRPVVDVGNSIGYLPGTMEEKVGPYLVPLFDELAYYVERSLLAKWLTEKTLEIVPLSMMRGRTFNNTFVILDEAQNAVMPELRMFLTRIGVNSKMVLTGDLMQSDLPTQLQGAFSSCVTNLDGLDGVAIVGLDASDIVRHRLIADIERRLCPK